MAPQARQGSVDSAGAYTVRGMIAQKNEGGDGSASLMILHEAVEGFRNRDGHEVRMDVMMMPFEVKRGLALEGMDAGDKVKIHFSVHWDLSPPFLIDQIEKLSPEVALNLEGYSLE